MAAVTYHQAMAVANVPESRFCFGSPCRFIPLVDFTCHLLIPEVLRKGDTSQEGAWDRARTLVASRLNLTSPRWKRVKWVDQ